VLSSAASLSSPSYFNSVGNGGLKVGSATPLMYACCRSLTISTAAVAPPSDVHSRNEILPLERAAEAYERMLSGQARFRVVLTMSS
jgi:hypothetical protein